MDIHFEDQEIKNCCFVYNHS